MLYLKNLQKFVKIEMFIGRKRGFKYENQRKQAHWGGGNSLKPSHIKGFSAMHVALCVNVGSYFINWCRDWLRCLDAWMQRGKVCYGNKNILSLGVESGCLNEVSYNHERGLSHELINFEPSPEFLSSLKFTKKFYPQHKVQTGSHASPQLCGSLCLTKREGDNFNDTVFSRFTSHFSLKSAAFTLAEVLITLGIIGVVAALSLPALINNYQKSKVEIQLKKSYSVLEQTIKMAENDYGSINDWAEWNNSEEILNKYFLPYLKGAKVYGPAGISTKAMCYDANSKKFSNDKVGDYLYNWFDGVFMSSPLDANTSSIKLIDGTCIGVNGTNITYPQYSKNFFIDVNGSNKLPNMAGKDLFFFYINSNGFIKPYGDNWGLERISSATKNNACNLKAPLGGYACAARIMAEGWKINYWNK